MTYQQEQERIEMEERFEGAVETEVENRLKDIVCDECGAFLKAIFEDGKIKVATYHSCDIQGSPEFIETMKKFDGIIGKINNLTKEIRSMK